jgi:hypothetical protein
MSLQKCPVSAQNTHAGTQKTGGQKAVEAKDRQAESAAPQAELAQKSTEAQAEQEAEAAESQAAHAKSASEAEASEAAKATREIRFLDAKASHKINSANSQAAQDEHSISVNHMYRSVTMFAQILSVALGVVAFLLLVLLRHRVRAFKERMSERLSGIIGHSDEKRKPLLDVEPEEAKSEAHKTPELPPDVEPEEAKSGAHKIPELPLAPELPPSPKTPVRYQRCLSTAVDKTPEVPALVDKNTPELSPAPKVASWLKWTEKSLNREVVSLLETNPKQTFTSVLSQIEQRENDLKDEMKRLEKEKAETPQQKAEVAVDSGKTQTTKAAVASTSDDQEAMFREIASLQKYLSSVRDSSQPALDQLKQMGIDETAVGA